MTTRAPIAFILCAALVSTLSCKGVIDASDRAASSVTGDASTDASGSCDGPDCASDGGASICGDGRREGTEECDDGNSDAGDGCDNQCKTPTTPDDDTVCGDGQLEPKEECDDGNQIAGDGCDRRCRIESCGNERRDEGEECDPPLLDQCDHDCLKILPNCGDGELQSDEGEECDDGNTTRGDGCNRCRKECGNGVLERDIGESCEPVYSLPDTCDESTCLLLPQCGDGKVDHDAGEECDPSDGISCIDCRISNDAGNQDGGAENPACGAGSGTPIVNGTFATDLTGWMPASSRVSASWLEEGAGGPGSAAVTYTANSLPNASVDGVVQCVPVRLGSTYTLSARYYNPSTNAPGVLPGISIKLFKGSLCQGDFFSGSGPSVSSTQDTWLNFTRSIDTLALIGAPDPNTPSDAGVQPTIDAGKVDGGAHTTDAGHVTDGGTDGGSSSPTDGGVDGGSSSPTDASIQQDIVGNNQEGALLIKLGAIVPAGTASGQMRFDDISFGSCGNCIIEPEAGEVCDDGNTVPGDGCSPTCQFECGNGQVTPPEQCDDGNLAFGDQCTPACRLMTSCDECALSSCSEETDACLALSGFAESGPAKGMARSALCTNLRDCIQDSGCNLNTAIANRPTLGGTPTDSTNPGVPENCYCGSSGVDCLKTGAANGSCRAEIEAALETRDPYQIIGRAGGFDHGYPVLAAAVGLLACETEECSAECEKPSVCGDGLLQDRTQLFATEFKFLINRVPSPCLDEYTHTSAGCSFEECDDGNTDNGDGCDDHCFVEACGNYLKQGQEECDDGNSIDGDGCDSNCRAEFVCGDGEVSAPFEDCEPPDTGTICSMDQYTTDPASCGCDDQCVYKVCGNGVVQAGEECDPPNGASCDATCQRSVDECTECILRIDDTQNCPSDLLLNGNGIPGDLYEKGCLEDPACLALWDCERESLCFLAPQSLASCYCGMNTDLDVCESDSSFVPTGTCQNEILNAFEAQWGRAPNSTSELLDAFFLTPIAPTGIPLSLTLPSFMTDICLVAEGGFNPSLREQLTASGLSPEDVDSCVSACLP